MKTNRPFRRYIFFIAFSGIILFDSCEQIQYNPRLNGNGTATAKFGDSTITYSFNIEDLGAYSPNGENVLSFQGSPTGFQSGFTLNTNAGFVGTYAADSAYVFISGILAATNGYNYGTNPTHTGIITINSYNPRLQTISGTFHFTAVLYDSVEHSIPADTIAVSNGNFIANIQIIYIPQD